MTMLAPMLLLGIWSWHRVRPASLRYALPAVLAANLVLPAGHVVWSFTIPIRSALTEIDNYRHPPVMLRPVAYIRRARNELRRGRLNVAEQYYEAALRLDSTSAVAYVGRASVRFRRDDSAGALRDIETALTIERAMPEALLLRGEIRVEQGSNEAAMEDLRTALDAAPPRWEHRAAAEELLKQAGGQQGEQDSRSEHR